MALRNLRFSLIAALLIVAFWGLGLSALAQDESQQEDGVSASPVNPDYIYDPRGKRDPFQSLLEIRKPVEPEEPQTPLQKFELDQLRLVGAIVGIDQPRAMVMAPDGKSYIVKNGTKVGKNNGVVVKILSDRIEIKESFYDFTGEVRTGIKTIQLPKREGV